MTGLSGKVAIVTGASKGMGSHFVDALVAAQMRVACLARPSAELDALAARYPDQVAGFACDVGDVEQVDRAVAQAAEHFGGIDILVNNAAIFHPFLLEESTAEQVRRHVDINLLGPIWCIRAAIPHLRARKGHVVSISSESVRMPFPFLSVYAATKAGLETLMNGLRDELREDGIRMTILRSGSVAGGTGGQYWDPDVAKRFYETIVRTGHAAFTGDFASPQSMAATLLAILSIPEDVSIDIVEARASRAAGAHSLARGAATIDR